MTSDQCQYLTVLTACALPLHPFKSPTFSSVRFNRRFLFSYAYIPLVARLKARLEIGEVVIKSPSSGVDPDSIQWYDIAGRRVFRFVESRLPKAKERKKNGKKKRACFVDDRMTHHVYQISCINASRPHGLGPSIRSYAKTLDGIEFHGHLRSNSSTP